MLDVSPQLVETLEDILPTYPEMFLETTTVPCISYFLYGSPARETGDTMEYSDVSFCIKIWDRTLSSLFANTLKVDEAMRLLGYRRSSVNTMNDKSLFCNVLIYTGLGKEFLNYI